MNIWTSLSEIVTTIGGALGDAFETVASLFYTPASSGTAASPTFLGYLAIGGLAISLIGYGFNFILRLINRKMR